MSEQSTVPQGSHAQDTNGAPTPGALVLAAGGFTPDIEVMTTGGPVALRDIDAGTRVYALDPLTRLAKAKPLAAVARRDRPDELVAIETQRSDLRVAPEHRILYRTENRTAARVRGAGCLDELSYYKFLRDWRTVEDERLETVDITEFLTDYEVCAQVECHGNSFRGTLLEGCKPVRRNSHIGYYFDAQTFKRHQSALEAAADRLTIHAGPKHHRRPYRFDGDDFLRLLGWYITEGSVHWSASSNTAQISFAQETPAHRQAIEALLDRMGLTGSQNERRFQFGSVVFGRLLERLCGGSSHRKRLPDLVWELPGEQQQRLLDVLVKGDGNDHGTYYTSSPGLASDVLRLCVELGIKPRYTIRDGIWRVFINEVFDGFQVAQHVTELDHEGSVVQLTMEDYSTILAGRNGKFQWVGVSRVE